MKEMLAKIIELDQMEQRLTDDALELKESVKHELDEYRETAFAKLKDEVAAEVEKKKVGYDAEYKKQCEAIDRKNKEADIRMKERTASGSNQWVDSIVARVLG